MLDDATDTLAPDAADGIRLGVAVSRYHAGITGRLLEGATATFADHGGRDGDLLVVPAPGAWELLPVAAAMIRRGDLDGVVCLGLILTGQTTHDRWLAAGLADGLAALSATHVMPVAFGVLTCQSIEQAEARAGGAVGNKGREAMESTIAAVHAIRAVRDGSPAGSHP